MRLVGNFEFRYVQPEVRKILDVERADEVVKASHNEGNVFDGRDCDRKNGLDFAASKEREHIVQADCVVLRNGEIRHV